MPSKKQRAKAKAKIKAKTEKKDDVRSVDVVVLSLNDHKKKKKKLSVPELKIREADRLNKELIEVVESFSSNFSFGKISKGTCCCRHGARCQGMVDGITAIFKEEIIKPEALNFVYSKLHSMTSHLVMKAFTKSKI
jgi:hypothetical protein